jgi:cell division septal protein FtsQ
MGKGRKALSRLEKLKNKDSLVYSRTEETKEPISFNKFYAFLFILLIGGLIYLVIFSGLLDIKNISVSGYEHGDTVKQIAEEEIGKNIITRNILFTPTRGLRDTLLGDPNVKNVKVIKKIPSTIVIEVEESKPALIWVSAGDRHLVDERGLVMGKVTDINNDSYKEIYDASNIVVKVGERVASPTFIKFINDISAGFEGATGTKLIKITLFDLLEDVHGLSSDGWTVYLNASKSADSQLNNLSRVLAEARKDTKKLQYIDMRLDNKIFYK